MLFVVLEALARRMRSSGEAAQVTPSGNDPGELHGRRSATAVSVKVRAALRARGAPPLSAHDDRAVRRAPFGLSTVARRVAASVAGGAGLALASPPLAWGWVGIPSLALLVASLVRAPARTALALGGASGAVYMGVLTWWLQQSRGTGPWIGLVLVQSGWLALAGVLTAVVTRLVLWPPYVAAVWSVAESLRASEPFGGFPWGRLGHTALDGPWEGLLPYLGVGVTGVALVSVAATVVWLADGVQCLSTLALRGVVLLGLIGLTLLPLTFPYKTPTAGVASVGIVQGGVPGAGNDVARFAERITDDHRRESETLAAAIADGSVPVPDLVVWPESSVTRDPGAAPDVEQAIQRSVDALGVPLLVGQISETDDPRFVRNQGVVRWPDEVTGLRAAAVYTKRHPVPFGEYIPFRSVLASLSPQLTQVPRDMLPGAGREPLRVGNLRIADAICFDVAYDDALEPQIARGATVAVVQTSNAPFFGTDQLAQQFAITRVKALTTGRSVVVASVNGISGAIGADGTVLTELPVGPSASTVVEVPLRAGLTPAIRWHTWLDATTFGVGGLGLAHTMAAMAASSRRGRLLLRWMRARRVDTAEAVS